ncbi:MAG: four-carbon acid sugar kinase family protein, partial [Opitutaceae bacterium]
MTHPVLEALPAVSDRGDFARVQALLAADGRKLVVLDDDPTGTQTVHGVPVLTEWSVASLTTALAEPGPCFYVLTNTRALALPAAAELNRELARNLAAASRASGRAFAVVSRGDSTLRGHFPGEVDALVEALGEPVDGTLIIPAFFEGGRYTVHGVHYVADGTRLVPAGETEFARDATFGYRSSALADWVEEKTAGRVRAADVAHIAIETLRRADGASAVCAQLLALPRGKVIVVDAAAYADLEVFVHGLLQAEAAGRRYVARTAAGFVRVRAGLRARPVLSAAEIAPPAAGGGLIVVGSYVAKTTQQLESALVAPGITPTEIHVDRLLDPASRVAEIARVASAADAAMLAGRHALLFTSRKLVSAVGRAGELGTAQIVSSALVAIVRAIQVRPRFVIAKGGITSSDLATQALGVKKALVLGQAAPGIPVWQIGAESRFP